MRDSRIDIKKLNEAKPKAAKDADLKALEIRVEKLEKAVGIR